MFKVGDEVVIREGAPYGITTGGSVGVITALWYEDTHATIVFSYLSSGHGFEGDVFDIDLKYCELNKTYTKEERVLNKIKQMEDRWKKFQTKKAACYV